MTRTESELQIQIADYLRLRYPDVLFHSDFGSSIGMTARQGALKKRQNGGRRGWPDMFIAYPVLWTSEDKVPAFIKESDQWDFYYISTRPSNAVEYEAYGLFLELKKDGIRLKKKNGDWVNEHVANQAKVLEQLRKRGYCAEFAVGFNEAVSIIEQYLSELKGSKIEF